jgi:hypothetical protein
MACAGGMKVPWGFIDRPLVLFTDANGIVLEEKFVIR